MGNRFSLQSFAILLEKFKKYDFNTSLVITLSVFIILSFSFYKFFQSTLENIDFQITIDAMAISLYDWTKALFKSGLFAKDARIISFTNVSILTRPETQLSVPYL